MRCSSFRLFVLSFLLAAPTSTASAQLLGRASSAAHGGSSDSDNDSSSGGSWSSSSSSDDYDGQFDEDRSSSTLSRTSRVARGRDRSRTSRVARGRDGSHLARASGIARGGSDYDEYDAASDSHVGVFHDARHSQPPEPADTFILNGCPYEGDRGGLGYVGEDRGSMTGAARIELEAGYALGGAGRGGVGGRVQLGHVPIDLTARYSLFVEPTEEGLTALALGRIGIDYRLIQDPVFQLRLGGGLRHLQDDFGGLIGGDASVGFDVFPVEPIVLSFEVTGGWVGEAALVQARGRIGFLIDRVEIYAGYNYEGLFSGGQQVDLGGPMAGVRVWL